MVEKLCRGLASDLHKCQAAQGVMLEETCPPSHLRNPSFSFTVTYLDIKFFKLKVHPKIRNLVSGRPMNIPEQCWDSQGEPLLKALSCLFLYQANI